MPLALILRDFLAAQLLLILALALADLGLEAAGLGPLPSGGAVGALLGAVFLAAHFHAERGGVAPTGARAWRIALALWAATLLLTGLLAGPVLLPTLLEGLERAPQSGEALAKFLAVLGVVLGSFLFLLLLALRYAFPWAVRQAERNLARARR